MGQGVLWLRRMCCSGTVAVWLCGASAAPEGRTAGANLSNPATDHKSCTSPARWSISGQMKLEPGCVYASTLTITESNTELDCRGSVVDPGVLKGYALHINSEGKELTGVTVRNCIFRNANAIGIVVGWRGADQDKVEKYERAEIYRRTPHGIRIVNTIVDSANGAGIYIDDYVSDVTLDHVTVTRSDSMGIYLEHSSRSISIEDSLFEDNSVGKKREAIAIDSSANNVIRRNVFRRNKAGGIFLYKNCHEHAAQDPKQTARWQGSDGNLIEGNRFEDEPIGVWIASRQSRDLRRLRCGDPYYGGKYVIDRASQNIVKGNLFVGVDRGVLVEDDNNHIDGNRFEQTAEVCIRVGSAPRAALLGRPVEGTQLRNNTCELATTSPSRAAAPKSSGIEFLYGSR